MEPRRETKQWMLIVIGLSFVLFTLHFVAGILLTKSIVQCVVGRGIPDWEDACRALLLLSCLPTLIVGVRRSLLASYLLLSGSTLALIITVLQRKSSANLHADGFIFVSMLMIGLFLYGRSAWLPQYQK